MKKLVCSILAFTMAVCLTFSAVAEEVVNVFNWEDYISDEALEMFTEETGIKVNYMCFTTNEDMLIKVRSTPSSFDVVFPSDYCVERLIAEDLLDTIDTAGMENYTNVMSSLLNPSYDPDSAYSVPYMWGTVGILYNTTMIDEEITSWTTLFDSKYVNNVFMLDSIRDSMGIALKYLGYSMNTRNPVELQEAANLLIKQKQDGIVKAYQVDETKDKMVAGEAALALMYSGDAMYAISLNSDLAYVVPEEGSNIWVDCMVIPKGAKNKSNAEKFIDFMCRPDIAMLNCQEIEYSSPNTGAIELMGTDYTDNNVQNPSEEIVAKCEYFNDIQDFITIYNTFWSEVKNSK